MSLFSILNLYLICIDNSNYDPSLDDLTHSLNNWSSLSTKDVLYYPPRILSSLTFLTPTYAVKW